MKALHYIFEKDSRLKLLLFSLSFLIYFIHFHFIFLNLNSVLSSITSDTLKNYYTYVYHIKFDKSALHFTGMAYPYGEHVVYTDCQPLLTFILRLFPFINNYLVGILHFLIFGSFIITPVLLFNIFRLYQLDKFSTFFFSIAIALLSPQFLKINAGHHGLAYAAMIPYSIYLISKYLKYPSTNSLIVLFIYHSLLFLIHPYMGFSICVFTLITFTFNYFANTTNKIKFSTYFMQLIPSIFPIILFKLFMLLTDEHPNRTNEPYGLNMMIENIDSILSPVFGPMKPIMEIFFNNRIPHYEGHTYLGIFTISLSLIFLLLLPFIFRKLKFQTALLGLFLASFILLLISFGLHNQICSFLGLDLAFMNQFRATCRFAWFFYYMLPIFIVTSLYPIIVSKLDLQKNKYILGLIPLLFFTINLIEAHYMFKLDDNVFWKFKNVFNTNLLNAEEQNNLKTIGSKKVQAIVPLPLFHSGSEMYDRKGFNYSMLPSMIYSSHTGIPILSVLMSRTSMSETKESINLLNGYKKNRPAVALTREGDFLVIKTEKDILPDEDRLFQNSQIFYHNDSLEFAFISKQNFLKRKLDSKLLVIPNSIQVNADQTEVVFIPTQNKKPFIETKMNEFISFYTLDSNKVSSGKYIVSVKYHYTLNNYHALACDMIVTEGDKKNYVWKYMLPMRFLSGFYDGFGVMEAFVDIDKQKKYEFVMAGREDKPYKISDFMLRPANTTVMIKLNKTDSCFNNFPQ